MLVSEDPSVVVLSEYRLCPVRRGFTLQVTGEPNRGKQVPMALYLWDRERGRTVARFTLAIEAK